jgi:hypothetical protein
MVSLLLQPSAMAHASSDGWLTTRLGKTDAAQPEMLDEGLDGLGEGYSSVATVRDGG